MKLHAQSLLAAFALVASSLSMPSFARDAVAPSVKQSIDLKDGATLHVFADGKMAKEDRYGRASYLEPGEVLETADGRKVTAASNELARLDSLLQQGHNY